MGTDKKQITSLQALRGLACMSVFFHHCQFPNIVYWAVSLFFVLSGFFSVYSDKASGFKSDRNISNPFRYSVSRIKKLYPLHVAITFFFLLLTLYWSRKSFCAEDLTTLAIQFILSIFLLQSLIPNVNYHWCLNTVSWYLSTLFFVFLLYPVLRKKFQKYKSITPALISIIILVITQYVLAYFHEPINRFIANILLFPEGENIMPWIYYVSPFFRSIDFMIGCNLAYIITSSKAPVSKTYAYTVDILCVLLFILAAAAYRSSDTVFSVLSFQRGPLFTPFVICIILSFYYNSGIISRVFTNRFTILIGNISAEFYLIHYAVIICMYRIADRFPINFEQKLITVTIVSAVLSLILSLVWRKLSRVISSNKFLTN